MGEWIAALDTKLLTVVEIAASSLLALGSIGVAAAAALFTRRSNVGHPPIIFFKSKGASGGGTAGNLVCCAFKVWNRRKYPLVIHEMQVSFGKVKLECMYWDGYASGAWFVSHNNNAAFFDEIVIQPGEQAEFNAAVTPVGRGEGLFDDDNQLTMWVRFFDPIKNRMVIVKARSPRRRFWHELRAWRLPKIFVPRSRRPGPSRPQPLLPTETTRYR